jgi:hypothetical protein
MARSKYTFKAGDRVAERPRSSALLTVRKEVAQVIAANSGPRFGTVEEIVIQKNSAGQNCKYCLVLWDYKQTPSLHAHCRLCLEEDWKSLTQAVRDGIGC